MEQRDFIPEEKEISQNQDHEACASGEGQSSDGKMAKDFKNTLKYKDFESYGSQHHHSIGTGLFLTDAIKDLPPRFRDKVIRALEEGAAVNNIPIERIPVESLFSVTNDSSHEKKKNLDSLVICPSSSTQDVSKSEKGKSDGVHTRKEYNAQKKPNSFHGSNSNLTSNSTQFGRGASLNVKNDNPSYSVKNKPHFKSTSLVSSHLKNNNRKDNHQKEKAAFQNNFSSTSHLVPNSNSSPSEICSEASFSHSKFLPKYSSSGTQKNSYKGETKNFSKTAESDNVKEKYNNSGNSKFHPHSSSSPIHSLSSVVQKSNYKGETKEFNKRAESNNRKEKYENPEFNKFYPNCNNAQYVSNPSSSKNKFSKSTRCSSKQDYYDNSNTSKNVNDTNLSCKQAFLSDASSAVSVKDGNRIGTSLPVKRTEFQEVSMHKDSRRSSSSSHSSFSHHDKDAYYNKDPTMLPHESHKNSDFSRSTHKRNFNPGDRAFSHTNSAYRQKEKNVEKFCEAPENIQSSFSDCSSQISNASIRTRSSSTSVSKHSNSNTHCESLNVSDKKLNKSKGNKTLKNQNFPEKQYDQECVKQDFTEGLPKVSYGNKNCNSQKSNHSKKSSTFNHKPVMHPERNKSERNGMTHSNSDQNLKSNISKNRKSRTDVGGCIEYGFFVKIEVSEEARNLEYWVSAFRSMFSFQFDLERCCHFSDILILELERKDLALKALKILWLEKKKGKNSKRPHIINISTLIYHLYKPCNCKQDVIDDSISNIHKHAETSLMIVDEKIVEIKNMKFEMKKGGNSSQNNSTKREMLKAFVDSKSNFLNVQKSILEK